MPFAYNPLARFQGNEGRKYLNFKKQHPELFHKRSGVENATTALLQITLIVVLVAGVTFIAVTTGLFRPQSAVNAPGTSVNPSTGCVGSYAAPSGYACTILPLNWVVGDFFAGSPVASVTIKAYNPITLVAVDAPSGTTSSAGALASISSWNSGTQFTCKVSAANYVTSFFPCTVPANPLGNTGLTTITMPLPIVKLGTWTITSTVAAVSGWSSTFSTYSFGQQSTSSVLVTWTIQETVNNAGYVSSIDRYTTGTTAGNFLVMELKSASSPKTSAAGCMYGTTINNVAYCQYILADGITTINGGYTQSSYLNSITSYFPLSAAGDQRIVASGRPAPQTVNSGTASCTGSASQQFSGSAPTGGTVTCTTTFNKGSLTGSESWTLTLFAYADPVWYDGTGGGTANGAYGGDQSIQTLSPSWSTVTLLGT